MMSVRKIIENDACRTCLSYFNEDNGKHSLLSCFAIASTSSRLELIRNIMTACSLTVFTDETSQENAEIFICMSCVNEIDRMLSFLEKCIHSETILKQVSAVKMENVSCWEGSNEDDSEEPLLPKLEVDIKVEENDGESSRLADFDPDDIPLSLYSETCNESDRELRAPRFACQECSKTFPSALSLAFHKYKHVSYKPHVCAVCNENFRTVQLVKEHMAAEHNEVHYQPFVCRQCPDAFTTRHLLTRHEQRRHNGKVYSCGACKRTFSTVSSLKFHENIHLGVRPYSCTLCSKSFTSASLLREHKRNVHSEIKKFQCHCGRSFSRKKKLECHIDSVHEKKDKLRKYDCPECEKKFYHPYALKNHLNTHLGIKPFLCNVCGSAFTALSNLTSHCRRIHSGEKQPTVKRHLCHNCGESFARASHLKRHNLRKHVPNAEKKYECPICQKKFLEKSGVAGHVKLHDDLKPFVCDQCTKCFRTSWRLQAHVKRVHLGLRPFECPTCSVKFKTKSHLEKHIRTHTGEKPFPCPHCNYTCAEKSNLKKHINIHLKAM